MHQAINRSEDVECDDSLPLEGVSPARFVRKSLPTRVGLSIVLLLVLLLALLILAMRVTWPTSEPLLALSAPEPLIAADSCHTFHTLSWHGILNGSARTAKLFELHNRVSHTLLNGTNSAGQLLTHYTSVCDGYASALPSLGVEGIIRIFADNPLSPHGSVACEDNAGSMSCRQPIWERGFSTMLFQQKHALGAWMAGCALSIASSTRNATLRAVFEYSSSELALAPWMDFGALLHGLVWVHMVWWQRRSASAVTPADQWAHVLRLCSPLSTLVFQFSACLHGAGQGFLQVSLPLTSYLLPLTSDLLPLTSYFLPLTSYFLPLRCRPWIPHDGYE